MGFGQNEGSEETLVVVIMGGRWEMSTDEAEGANYRQNAGRVGEMALFVEPRRLRSAQRPQPACAHCSSRIQ